MSAPDPTELHEGTLVVHPRKPEWGPGRVLSVQGSKLKVYFRDLRGDDPNEAVKEINTDFASLQRADTQSDPLLDNLPPLKNGKLDRPPGKRVTLQEGIEKFHSYHPLYFEDPRYIGDLKEGERAYKWATHELFIETLGGGQLRSLLAAGAIDDLRERSLAIVQRVNLLAVFEKVAFRDGVRDDIAATRYFGALARILEAPEIEQESFETYLHAVGSLPSDGNTSPAKWTIATFLPYMAQPDRFMFLKPEKTKDCAARLTFDLRYSTQLNWQTYSRLLKMADHLLEELKPYGARDFIDVQSFIWVVGGGLEQ